MISRRRDCAVDLPGGSLCRQVNQTAKLRPESRYLPGRGGYHQEDGCVLGAECTVVTVECRRRPVTHVAGLVPDAVDCDCHDRCIDVDSFTLRQDSLVVTVSEETGIISLAVDGQLIRPLTPQTLRTELTKRLEVKGKAAQEEHQK